MSLETRSTSALFKRADQLKRWEESETNREPVSPKRKSRRIKFSSGCVFLAACAAGDKDEVIKLLEKGADINTANVDGLTALHQACIDDNLDMVEFLVENGADVNRGDNEGWTPLHATASCGFLYIAKYLIEKGANVAAVNNDGELPLDIAATECQKMEDLLKEEIEKRGIDCESARNQEEMIMLRDAKDWLATKSSLVNTAHLKTGATPLHVASAKGYMDVIKILLQCGADIDAQDVDGWTPLHAGAHWGQKEVCQVLVENLADMDAKNFVGQTVFDLADTDMLSCLEDLRKKQNKEEVFLRRLQAKKRQDPLDSETPSKVKKVEMIVESETKSNEISDMDVSSESESSESESSSSETESESSDDEKKNRVNAATLDTDSVKKILPLTPKIIENTEDNTPWRKPPPKQNNPDISSVRSSISNNISNTPETKNETEVTIRRPSTIQSDKELGKNDSVTKNITVNISAASTDNTPSPEKSSPLSSPQSNNQQPFRRSFVPPVRDEESETQRKAHAKRVRETRRSTQGVTLEEIKSAEQFVKKSNSSNNNNTTSAPTNTSTSTTTATTTNTNETLGSNGDSSNGVVVTATITTATPTVKTTRESEDVPALHERRPSWRLRLDNGTSKFKLEDASKPADVPTVTPYIRRTNISTTSNQRPSSAPAPLETADTTVTLPLRRPKTVEEKVVADQDKENEMRNAQATLATQAAIQRRRRPKRRSTGVVSFDNVDDMDQEKDPTSGKDCDDVSKVNHIESGPDRSSRSRISSTSDIRNENGEIDYKKLYEQQLLENDRLKDKLRKSDEELRETKQTLEKINVVTSKNSLSELEKREKRAMERKLSEMEEELKNLENLKSENQRLKDENGALIRVISKLSK